MTLNNTANTARGLLSAVQQYGPAVEDGDLTFATDPPPELDAVLRVLHTGVRALLAGRRWWGSTSEKPRVIELNPAEPIPADITLLTVEGDRCWDRIAPDAQIDFPKLFVSVTTRDR